MRKFRAKQEKIRKNKVKAIKILQNFPIKLEKLKISLKKSDFVGNFNRLTKFCIYSTFFKEKLRISRKILEFSVIKLTFLNFSFEISFIFSKILQRPGGIASRTHFPGPLYTLPLKALYPPPP